MATDANVSYGKVRRGHGLRLRITGPCRIVKEYSLKIDLIGPVFAGQSSLVRAVAENLLPFALTHFNTSNAGSSRTLDFVLGAKKLSHGRIKSELELLERAGDPLFVVEVSGEERGKRVAVAQFATRASAISASLSIDGSCVAPGGIPPELAALADRRRKGSSLAKAYWTLRWWMLPLGFTALCWLLASGHPAVDTRRAGPLVFRPTGDKVQRGARLDHLLPPTPKSMHAAFELGGLAAEARLFSAAGAHKDWSQPHSTAPAVEMLDGKVGDAKHDEEQTQIEKLLRRAATLVSRGADTPLTLRELELIQPHLLELEQHTGLVARVRGAFNFVNLVWLVSILGIAISIGPSVTHLLKPIRQWLYRAARWLLRHVIEPVVARLHSWGIIELVVWAAAAAIRLDADSVFDRPTGNYIAVTSLALALGPCYAYSTFLWATRLQSSDRDAFIRITSCWAAVTLAPVAHAYQSTLLAYLSVFALYSALGFSVACYGLCWCIGFTSKRAVERVVATSALTLVIGLLLRELGPRFALSREALGVFSSPLAVVGSLTLYLGLLITSSLYYDRRSGRYLARNMLTLGALLAGAAAGFVSGQEGLANTACTFVVLWTAEKYGELHCEAKWNGWVLLLVMSIAAYRAALWMHDHPAFVASIFE